MLVSTQPDQDRLAGLVEVLQRFKVRQILYPDLDYKSTLHDEWHKLINEKGIKQTIARAGQQIDLGGGVIINVLNPQPVPPAGTGADIDYNSLVLRLRTGDISFLFTADTTKETERELIRRRAAFTSTVLKVAHHGSDTSTSREFLAVVNPQIAVISTGAGNKFGHPDSEVLSRLRATLGPKNIYRTDKQGTIEFITDGQRLWVEVGR